MDETFDGLLKIVSEDEEKYGKYKDDRNRYFEGIEEMKREFNLVAKLKEGILLWRRGCDEENVDVGMEYDVGEKLKNKLNVELNNSIERNIVEMKGGPHTENEAFFVVEMVERIEECVRVGKALDYLTIRQSDYNIACKIIPILKEKGVGVEIGWCCNNVTIAYRVFLRRKMDGVL